MNVDGHPKVLTGGVDAEANWERFWAARDAVDRQNNPVLQGVELGQGIKTAIETDDCREAGRKIGQLGALVVGTVLMVRDIIPGQPRITSTPPSTGGTCRTRSSWTAAATSCRDPSHRRRAPSRRADSERSHHGP
jgi:hypothetical protein